jgi:ABC-type antimicrobial peptide transport system permease subunit
MKRIILNIFAIVLTITIVFSQIGIELHHHLCNLSGKHKVSLSPNYFNLNDDNYNCACEEPEIPCSDINYSVQHKPSLKGAECCTNYIAMIILNDIVSLTIVPFKEIKPDYHYNFNNQSDNFYNLAWLESNVNKTKFLPPKGRNPNKATIEYIHSSTNYTDDFSSEDALDSLS